MLPLLKQNKKLNPDANLHSDSQKKGKQIACVQLVKKPKLTVVRRRAIERKSIQ